MQYIFEIGMKKVLLRGKKKGGQVRLPEVDIGRLSGLSRFCIYISNSYFCDLCTSLLAFSIWWQRLLFSLMSACSNVNYKLITWRQFIVCSHTFALFWLRKASVIAEISQVPVCSCVLSSGDLITFLVSFPFFPFIEL